MVYSSGNVLSDLRRREGKSTDAYELRKRAKEIAEKEVATSSWVSASVYKMDHVRLKQCTKPFSSRQAYLANFCKGIPPRSTQITSSNKREKEIKMIEQGS